MKASQVDSKGLMSIVETMMSKLQYELDKQGYHFITSKRSELTDMIFSFLDDEIEPFFDYNDLEDEDKE